jgi:hypothetical protein
MQKLKYFNLYLYAFVTFFVLHKTMSMDTITKIPVDSNDIVNSVTQEVLNLDYVNLNLSLKDQDKRAGFEEQLSHTHTDSHIPIKKRTLKLNTQRDPKNVPIKKRAQTCSFP